MVEESARDEALQEIKDEIIKKEYWEKEIRKYENSQD